jgi:ABC-2 type transport system permease protein
MGVTPTSMSHSPAGTLRRYAALYWLFLTQRLKILMEYRVNFMIGAASTIMMQAAGLLTIWVVMRQVPTLNGWRYDEVLLIYGLITLTKSINHMFADNLWTVGRVYIRSGDFDRFLVRPIDPLFHLLADRFCHDGVGNFLVGAALVIKSSLALGIIWSPLNMLMLAVGTLSGGLIFIGLNMITAVSAFWIMDSVPVTRVIFEIHEFAKYPLTMYHRSIGILLTWLIPFGFASFYPASYMLAWLSPVVALVLLFIGYRAWRFGLRHYTSTGS